MSDELEVLQYTTAGVDVTVIDAVQIPLDERQKTRKFTRLNTSQTYTHTASNGHSHPYSGPCSNIAI